MYKHLCNLQRHTIAHPITDSFCRYLLLPAQRKPGAGTNRVNSCDTHLADIRAPCKILSYPFRALPSTVTVTTNNIDIIINLGFICQAKSFIFAGLVAMSIVNCNDIAGPSI